MLQLKYFVLDQEEEKVFQFVEKAQYNVTSNNVDKEYIDLNIISGELSLDEKARYLRFCNALKNENIEKVKLYYKDELLFDNEIFSLIPKEIVFHEDGEYVHLPDGKITDEFINNFKITIHFANEYK